MTILNVLMLVGAILFGCYASAKSQQDSPEVREQEANLIYKIRHRQFTGGIEEGELRVQLFLPPIVRKMSPESEQAEESSPGDD